jgi:hypothetical protein
MFWEKLNGLVALKVDENRAVAMPFPHRPLINTNNTRRWGLGE